MIVSILVSIIIWGSAAFILLRVVNNSGISLKKEGALSFITANKSQNAGFETSKNEILSVFGFTFAFRVIIFILSVFIMYIFNDKINGWNGVLDQYMKWDANNYFRIATGGYSYYTENGDFTTLAFFPLYPCLMRALNIIFRDLRLTGLVLSSLLYSGGCCFLYKLLAEDYNKNTAIRTIKYISVFPHAFFFGTIMNESMLLFTSAATLYYIRRHNWMLVGVFGALASLSRMVGIMLAFPAAVEWLEEYKIFEKLKNKDFRNVWKLFYTKGSWIFLMLFGTGIYLFCNYKTTGQWFKFLEYQQKYWNHHTAYFGTGISNLFDKALNSGDGAMTASVYLPSVISVIFVLVSIIYGICRTSSMYTTYLVAYLLINMSVDWIISTPRYMTCAVPAFIILADFSERHKWSETLITISMSVGMGVYLTAYLCWKQIL